MPYGFTCPACGHPLTQKTVVFDLLDPPKKQGTDRGTLCLTQKELQGLWKKSSVPGRRTVKLSWKSFLKYLSNSRNWNCPELQKLTYKEARMFVQNQVHKKHSDQPQRFIRLRAQINMSAEHLNRELERIIGIFEDGGGVFHRDVEPHYENGLLTGLTLYNGRTAERTAEVSRCCSNRRCGKPVFRDAGALPQICVVLVAPTERSAELRRVLDRMKTCLTDYQGDEMGRWTASEVSYERGTVACATVKVRLDDKETLLTLAAAPEKFCTAKDRNVCFFPGAAAYVLCDERVERKSFDKDKRKEKDRELLDALVLLQTNRMAHPGQPRKRTCHGPVLLVYGSDFPATGYSDPKKQYANIERIFKDDCTGAQDNAACRLFCVELEKQLKECYYTQMFYCQDEVDLCIQKAVRWILHVSGILPLDLKDIRKKEETVGLYTVAPPVYKGLLPDEQQKLRPGRRAPSEDLYRAEMIARIHLFDNAKEIKKYFSLNGDRLKQEFWKDRHAFRKK